MRIREAAPGDAAAITRLIAQLGYAAEVAEVTRRLDQLPAVDAVMVAEVDDAVVGWVHVAHQHALQEEPGVDIRGLVVEATHRGSGVGRALVAACEDWARHRGLAIVRVRSRSTRVDAHAFYEAAGFERIKTSAVFVKRL